MIPRLSDTSTCLIYDLPGGKTVYKDGAITQVPQGGQKGPTCWYYTLAMIRERIGKDPARQDDEFRVKERELSARRKTVTQAREQLEIEQSIAEELLTDPHYTHRKLWEKPRAAQFIIQLDSLISEISLKEEKTTDDLDALKEFTHLKRFLARYVKQDRHSDFRSFLAFEQEDKFIKYNKFFLSKLGKQAESYFKEDSDADISRGEDVTLRSLDEASPAMQRALLENYVFRSALSAYHLTISPWMPYEGKEKLFATLQSHGPMYVKGRHGQNFYETSPSVICKIAERSILGWKKTDPKVERDIFHSVVAVGCNLQEPGYVYYVDPTDASAPDRARPIYISSYTGFIHKLGDLRNRSAVLSPGEEPFFFKDFGYGVHGIK